MRKTNLLSLRVSIIITLLLIVTGIVTAQNYPAFSSINWKGAYVTGTTGGDGSLAAAFDGLTTSGDKYGSNGLLPVVITAQFPNPIVLTTYAFTTISWNELGRSPKTWKVEASNDGSNWTQLDEVIGYTNFTATYQTREFTFVNATSYRYYRIVIREIGSGSIFGVSEISFPEYTGTGLAPWFPINPITPIGTTRKLNSERPVVRCVNDSIEISAVVYTNKAESPIAEGGFVYGTTPAPTLVNSTKQVVAITTEAYTTKIVGLNPGTVYYIRPFATNANGTTYGAEFILNTSDSEGSLFKTSAPAKVSSFSAELPVNILSDGGATITERGIVWAQSSNPTIDGGSKFVDAEVSVGTLAGKLSGLTPGTLYFVRPYIKSANGTKYGAQYAFYSSNVEQYNWKNAATVETDWSVESWSWGNSLYKAFNGNTNNFWVYQGVNAYMQFNFNTPQTLSQYVFTPNAGVIARAPKDWVLVASNDKQSWVTLDARVGITDWTGSTTKTFDFTNTTAYSYYRINFTAPQSGDIYRVATFDFPQFTGLPSSIKSLSGKSDVDVRTLQNSIIINNKEQESLNVYLYDIRGINVVNVKSQNQEVRINNLSTGLYFVKINCSGKIHSTKVIIW